MPHALTVGSWDRAARHMHARRGMWSCAARRKVGQRARFRTTTAMVAATVAWATAGRVAVSAGGTHGTEGTSVGSSAKGACVNCEGVRVQCGMSVAATAVYSRRNSSNERFKLRPANLDATALGGLGVVAGPHECSSAWSTVGHTLLERSRRGATLWGRWHPTTAPDSTSSSSASATT